MSVYGPKVLFPTTALAGAAIVSNRFVKRGADENMAIQATGPATNILGVSWDNQDNIGRTFPVAYRAGELPTVEAGAVIALDAPVTSDALGRAVTAITGQPFRGYARQAATLVGQLIVVELTSPGVVAP